MKPKTWCCTRCKKRKDFTKAYFGAASHNKHGLSLKCRNCINRMRREH
ncbi:MAG: hypothetical protein HY401_01915 [Elusimicrobia bacterium]|nr:hypothetical protein [Elusimicrobiota bacterium]